jgi:hypothetical protein
MSEVRQSDLELHVIFEIWLPVLFQCDENIGPVVSFKQEPLDKPNMDQSKLLAWAAAAASDIMTFSYPLAIS